MYCKKCGKFIGNEADFCDECAAKEDAVFAEFFEKKTESTLPPFVHETVYNGGKEIRLGKAIAAMILSEIGLMLIYIGIILMGELAMVEYTVEYSGAIACMLIGCIPCVLGLIFGIQSICNFKATSMVKSGKRIPVLILGILSVVSSGLGLFLLVIMLMAVSML